MSYNRQGKGALATLKRKGATLTLTRPSAGRDLVNGTLTGTGKATALFAAVKLPPGKGADKEIGTLVNRNIAEFHMALVSGSLVPQAGDEASFGGVTWTLIWTAPYDPDGSGTLGYTKAYGEAGK